MKPYINTEPKVEKVEKVEKIDVKAEIDYFVKLLDNPNLSEGVKEAIEVAIIHLIEQYQKPIYILKDMRA
jgi:hypothetical protein